jgi:VCBS repeat-containing protein
MITNNFGGPMELSRNSFKTLKESFVAYVLTWAVLAILVCYIPASHAKVIEVCAHNCIVCADNCQYTRIQDAINNAAPNDTVYVSDGHYTETIMIGDYWDIPPQGGKLSINPNPKQLTHVIHLVGAHANEYSKGTNDRGNESVILGQVFVNTKGSNVSINGFTIDSSMVTPYNNDDLNSRIGKSAIMVASGPSSDIRCNIVKNAQRFGIRNGYILGEAPDTHIVNNRIVNAKDAAILNHVGNDHVQIIENNVENISDSVDGIQCLKYENYVSTNTIIQKNVITGGHIGILNDSGNDSQIIQNMIQNSKSFAILTTARALISENTISTCKDGIRTEYDGTAQEIEAGTGMLDRVEIKGNTISNINFSGINICGTHTFVSENTLEHCNIKSENDDTPDYDYASIHVEAQGLNGSHSIITKNFLSDGGNGIQVWADYVTVSKNTLENFGASSSYLYTKIAGDNRLYMNSPIIVGSNFGKDDFDPVGLIIDQPDVTVFYSEDLNHPPKIENLSNCNYVIEQNTILNDIHFKLSDTKQTSLIFKLSTEPEIIAISALTATTNIETLTANQYQVALDEGEAIISFNISAQENRYGKTQITCEVDDGTDTYMSESESTLYTVSVISKPVLSDIPNQTIDEGQSFTSIVLDNYVEDMDDNDDQISWSCACGNYLTVTILDRIASIIILDENWNGTETITFTAIDKDGFTANDTATYTVNPVNDPPVLLTIPGQTIDEDKSFTSITLTDYVTDADHDVYSLTWHASGQDKLEVSIVNGVATISISEMNWSGSENITFTATDPGALSAYTVVSFTVNPVNDPPVVSDILDQTVDEGKPFSPIMLDNYVEDVEDNDDQISWSCACGSHLTVTMLNRIASVTALDEEWHGTETITCTAKDTDGATATDSATFTVNPVNDPPVLLPIPGQTIDEDTSFTSITLTDYVTDSDHDVYSLDWHASGQDKLDVSIVNGIATISISEMNWSGSENIIFTATDPGALSAYTVVSFTVNPVNDPPVVSDILDQTVDEGKPFSPIMLDNFVEDVEDNDDQISWSCACGSHLTVTTLNRIASVTALDKEWNGTETITCTAKDTEGATANDSATFTVNPVNDPPVLLTIPDQTIDEDKSFTSITLTDYVTDVDHDEYLLAWDASGQDKLDVSIVNGIATISISETNWFGSENITFKATDPGGLSAYTVVSFVVNPVNDPPVVSDILDQTVNEGTPFTSIMLDNFVEDVEDNDDQISWSCACGSHLTVNIIDRVASITPLDENWNGTETITFTAKDTKGATATDSATFIVNPVNDHPVLLTIPGQTIDEDKSFTSITLTDYVTDADHDVYLLAWDASGQDKLDISIVNGIATISISETNWFGSENITFTATDPGGLSAYTVVSFVVNPVNDPPVLSDILDQTVNEGTPFTSIMLDNFVEDIDDNDDQITWSCACGNHLTVTILDRIATITAIDENWNGTETITFTAMDTKGATATDSATFIVNPVNDHPVLLTIPGQTIDEDKSFTSITLTDYVTDADHDVYLLAWDASGQDKLDISIVNGIATISISETNWFGSENITFTATDPGGLSAYTVVSFVVNPVNDPPVLSDILDQTVNEGTPFTSIMLDNFVEDIDDNDDQITWSCACGNHLTVTILDRIATITAIDENWNGTETITFTAMDTKGATASNSAIFTVNPVNDAPVLSTIPDQTIDEDKSFTNITLTDYVTDADHDVYSITWDASGQEKLMVSIDNGVASINISELNWYGTESITFTATDPETLTAQVVVSFIVSPVNDEPIITSIQNQSITEGFSLIITSDMIHAADIEDDDETLIISVQHFPNSGQLLANGNLVYSQNSDFEQGLIMNDKLVYYHNGAETIEDSFRFIVLDSEGLGSDIKDFVIAIQRTNDTPELSQPSDITVTEAFSITITDFILHATDEESSADQLTYLLRSLPESGLILKGGIPLTLQDTFTQQDISNSLIVYAHDGEESQTDTFSFKLSDNDTEDEAIIGPFDLNINIIPVNDPPTIVSNVGITVDEEAGITITSDKLFVRDPDTPSNLRVFQLTRLPDNGILYLDNSPINDLTQTFSQEDIDNNSLRYKHDGTETKNDHFRFMVTDDYGNKTQISSFEITIIEVNDPPVANDFLNESTDEDTPHSGRLSYTDSENYSCVYQLMEAPSMGTVTINDINGSYVYTPNENENGQDSFTYQVKDESLLSNIATVRINIIAVNDNPQIINNGISLLEGASALITTTALSAFDPDHESNAVIFQIEQLPEHGILSIDSIPFTVGQIFTLADIQSKFFRYKHNDSDTKLDYFLFNVTDGTSLSESHTFTLIIEPVNDQPVAKDFDDETTDEDQKMNGQLGYEDSDSEACTFHLVSGASKGIVVIDEISGAYSYTPIENENGEDSFTYQVKDETLFSDVATVTIFIEPVNDPPHLLNNGIILLEGYAATITTNHLSAIDVDNENNDIIFQIEQLPKNGTLSIESVPFLKNQTFTLTDIQSNSIRYTHDGSETESDDFKFNVTDGTYLSESQTFTMNVIPENDQPTAIDLVKETNEDTILINHLESSDPEDHLCTYRITMQPSHGTIQLDGDGYTFTYHPDTNYNGHDVFQYLAEDIAGSISEPGTVTINVLSVNDPPEISDIPANINLQEGGRLIIASNILSATDPDNSFHFTLSQLPLHGTIKMNDKNLTLTDTFSQSEIDDSIIQYVHDGLESTSDCFYVSVQDADGLSDSKTITLTINGVNDPPVANSIDNLSTDEDISIQEQLSYNDPEGMTCTYHLKDNPSKGTVTINETSGCFIYTPNHNEYGDDSFSYFVKDNENEISEIAIVNIQIQPLNDSPVIETIDDIYLAMNMQSDPIHYSISDAETPSEYLIVAFKSTNPELIDFQRNELYSVIIKPYADKVGKARVIVTVTDENEASTTTDFIVHVRYQDTTPPVLTLIGNSLISIEQGTQYVEQNATAEDSGIDISSEIIIGGDIVDTNTPGRYQIEYSVTDSAGNEAIPVYRTVVVYSIPTITVTGQVFSESYTYLANVLVSDSANTFTVSTNEEGVFTYSGLKKTGEMHYLTFSLDGYETITKKFSGFSPYDKKNLEHIEMLAVSEDLRKIVGTCTDYDGNLLKNVQIELSAPDARIPFTSTTQTNENGQYTIVYSSKNLPSKFFLKTYLQGYESQNFSISENAIIVSPYTKDFNHIPRLTRIIIENLPDSTHAHALAQDQNAVTFTVSAMPIVFSNEPNEFSIVDPPQSLTYTYDHSKHAYIVTYPNYQSFALTLQADTTEDFNVNTDYYRTMEIHFTRLPESISSYTATVQKAVPVEKGLPVTIKSSDITSQTILEIPAFFKDDDQNEKTGMASEKIPETIDFNIEEYDGYTQVESKVVSINIFDDQGHRLGDEKDPDNPLQRIYITMEYLSTVTRDQILEGDYRILHAKSAAEIFEGKQVPYVPIRQIDKDKTDNETVTFWVNNLSAFAIQKETIPIIPPSRELPHPPSNCFIQSAQYTAYTIGYFLSLLIIGSLTGVMMTYISRKLKQNLASIIGLIFCMTFVFSNLSFAQMQTQKAMFSLMPGGMVFEKNKNIGDGPVIGVGLGYSFTPRLDAELLAIYGQHNVSFWDETKQEADYEKSNSYSYFMNIQYHLTSCKVFVPYLNLGIGSMDFESDDVDNKNALRLNYGLGAKYFLNESIALRGDVYHLFSFDDPDNQLVCSLGLTFQLGTEPTISKVKRISGPDADGDGVTDSKDECPDTPARLLVNRVGCPKDSDMDGVYDNLDECPNTPDHAIVDRAGCPKDSDMDGVYDHLDQCPDSPKHLDVNPMGCPPDKDKDAVPDYKDACPDTPAKTPVDSNGCSIDHDGDGVLDSQDKCPNTPDNTRVDKNGCPIILDLDNDGIPDSKDQCPDSKPGVHVNRYGCQVVIKKQVCLPYAVQVSSYPTRQKAHEVVMKYRKKGDPLFVSTRKSAGKTVFSIFYGVYHTQAEAEKTVILLKQRRFKNVLLMNLPYAIYVEPNEIFIDDATVKKQLIQRGFAPYDIQDGTQTIRYYVGAYINEQSAKNIVNLLLAEGFKAKVQKRCIEKILAKKEIQSVETKISDQDNDGVPDIKDRCPDTQKDARVDSHGCQILEKELVKVPYAVQVSSYPTRKQAHAVVMKYRKRGEPLFASMIQSTDKKVFSIFYGVYESTIEADRVALDLKKRHFKNVMRLKLPYAILVQPNTVYVDIDTVCKKLVEKGFIAYKLNGSNGSKYYVGAYPNEHLATIEAAQLKNEGFDTRVEKRTIIRSPEMANDLPYVLLISAYSEQKKAFDVAKHFRKKGDPTYNSYRDVPDTDKDHEIYYGYYQSPTHTEEVIKNLKKRRFRQADLKNKPYAVCVGIVDQHHDLAELESQLSEKGYLSYSIPVFDRPDLRKVYVGAFQTKAEAKLCLQKMKADGFIPTIVLRSNKRSDVSTEIPRPAFIDSDKDGISDAIDKCANTPPHTLVLPDGCPKPKIAPKPKVPLKDRETYPYTIQINAYPNKAKVMDIIRKFRTKGDPMYMSYIKQSPTEDSFGIYYGYYQSFDAVKKVAAQLKARHFRRVDILKMPYCIQLGIFSSDESIDALETKLYKKGYASYRLFQRAGESFIQVLIGAYKTKQGAEHFKALLISDGFDAKIVERIGAPAAQPKIPLITVLQDQDKDGILDEADQCPETKEGDIVNQDGCSIAQISEQDFETKPLFTPLISSQKNADSDDYYPYTIRVSSYKDREAANQVAIKFRQKGDFMYTSYGQTKDGKPIHDVFFGFYRNFEESQMAAMALERRHFKNIEMIKMPYAVQLGVFDSYTDLVKKENELMSKGYLTYSIPDRDDISNIRLLVGAYPTQEAAENIVEELTANGFSSVIVKR